MKCIGIDARFLGTETGIGRYVEELIKHLEEIDAQNQYLIFLAEKNWDKYEPKNKNFNKITANFRWYSWQEQAFFPFLIKKNKIDLMHFPHFNGPLFCPCPFIVTIHDLILLHHPSVRASKLGFVRFYLKYVIYRFVLKNAILNSKAILVPSEFTKEDILKSFSVPAGKIAVTYEAASLGDTVPVNQEFFSRLGIARPYFLTVGNAYPHKNLERLFRVFKKLNVSRARQFQLVFVGPDDYFYGKMKEFAKNLDLNKDDVIMPGKVSDGELKTLYLNAFAYVFPSLYEGFGLPALEAMSCGAPVLSSNKTSLSEVLGDAVLYFDAESDDDLTRVLNNLADDKGLQSRLREKGFEQARKYSWQSLAERTLEEYLRSE